jgi:hypothetical protein
LEVEQSVKEARRRFAIIIFRKLNKKSPVLQQMLKKVILLTVCN